MVTGANFLKGVKRKPMRIARILKVVKWASLRFAGSASAPLTTLRYAPKRELKGKTMNEIEILIIWLIIYIISMGIPKVEAAITCVNPYDCSAAYTWCNDIINSQTLDSIGHRYCNSLSGTTTCTCQEQNGRVYIITESGYSPSSTSCEAATCECPLGTIEQNDTCVCDESFGYTSGNYATTTNTYPEGSLNCIYKCANRTDGVQEFWTASSNSGCESWCNDVGGTYGNSSNSWQMCSLKEQEECSPNLGQTYSSSGACTCDEKNNYVNFGLNGELDCRSVECFDDTQFYDTDINACVQYCGDGSNDSSCRCYSGETKNSIQYEGNTYSICFNDSSPNTENPNNSPEHCSNDSQNEECICNDSSNKRTMTASNDLGAIQIYYCQNESQENNECGTISGGNYVSNDLANSCTCSSGEKKTGTLSGDIIAYCNTESSSNDTNTNLKGDWATETTGRNILATNEAIKGIAENINLGVTQTVDKLGEIKDELSEAFSGNVTSSIPIEQPELNTSVSEYNFSFANFPEIQAEIESYRTFIQEKTIEINELFGFDDGLGGSGGELPCFTISGEPFAETTKTVCFETFVPIFNIVSSVFLFISSLAAVRIILS